MLRKYLPLILAALVALQSIAAMADSQQFHETDGKAFEFDNISISINTVSNTSGVEKFSQQNSIDSPSFQHSYHHCCHCHGFLNSATINDRHTIDISSLGSDASEYYNAYFSHHISPDIRPPIV